MIAVVFSGLFPTAVSFMARQRHQVQISHMDCPGVRWREEVQSAVEIEQGQNPGEKKEALPLGT